MAQDPSNKQNKKNNKMKSKKARKKQQEEPPKKTKLRRESDIYNRLRWDTSNDIDLSHVLIVHEGKRKRLEKVAFSEFKPISEGGDVPFHRIKQFLYNDQILWDREQRIDNLNKNSGITTQTLDTMHEAHHTSHASHALQNNSKTRPHSKRAGSKSNKSKKNSNSALDAFVSYDALATRLLRRHVPQVQQQQPSDSLENVENSEVGAKISTFASDCDAILQGLFATYRASEFDLVARYFCWKCLSCLTYLCDDTGATGHKYVLFGSASLQLDTSESDLDVAILLDPNALDSLESEHKDQKESKSDLKQSCVSLLNRVKNDLFALKKVKFVHANKGSGDACDLSEFVTESAAAAVAAATSAATSAAAGLGACPFDVGVLQRSFGKICNEKNIDCVEVKIGLATIVSEASVPKAEIKFDVSFGWKDGLAQCKQNVSMDVVVHDEVQDDTFSIRNKHLKNWMQQHCFDSKDKRIHCYLFVCKLWSQKCGICSSKESTINGYGWLHIALFSLFYHHPEPSHTANTANKPGDASNETIYRDVHIDASVSVFDLFLQFLQVLGSWMLLKNPQKVVRAGREIVYVSDVMDVIKGALVSNQNTRMYALYVLDPFVPFMKSSQAQLLNDNLAKCVRSQGLQKIRNAVAYSLQQLHVAFEKNDTNLFANLFNTSSAAVSAAAALFAKGGVASETEQKMDDAAKETETGTIGHNLYSWQQLCEICANNKKTCVPTRGWLNCMNNKNKDKNQNKNKRHQTARIGTFNMLADSLTKGYEQGPNNKHYTFICDPEYLQFESYRLPRLVYEMLQYDLDIICCQEIEQQQLQMISKCLNYAYNSKHNISDGSDGYECIFMKKTNVFTGRKHLKKKVRNHFSDGCAIFWKTDKFEKISEYDCKLTFGNAGLVKETGKFKKSPNIAICTRLKSMESDNVLDVWTTHLKAGRDDANEVLRKGQIEDLMSHILYFSDTSACEFESKVMLLGDMNSGHVAEENVTCTPQVYPYVVNDVHYKSNFETQGKRKGKDTIENEAKTQGIGMDAAGADWGIKFDTCWMQCMGEEPSYSHWAGWKDRISKCKIDHMFVGTKIEKLAGDAKEKEKIKGKGVQVRKVLDVWDGADLGAIESRMPSFRYPSDHLLMACIVEL